MRRYIYIFGLTVLFWGTSCADFINIQPENATTYSNYYKNEKELEAVLTGLQVYLRQAVGEFTGGDDFHAFFGAEFNPAHRAAPDHCFNARTLVFQCEIGMA